MVILQPLLLNGNNFYRASSFNTGLTDVMRFLIDQGAEVDTGNGLGLTPLLVAVLNGNFEAAKVKLNQIGLPYRFRN